MQVDAVVVAAGRSTRFGEGDKLLADLNGRPLIAWTLAALAEAGSIGRVAIVGREELLGALRAIGREVLGEALAAVVPGGARRRDSVEAGLRAVASEYVAIHDGARPLVTPALIDACVAEAAKADGAILVGPVTDTIKEVEGDTIVGSPQRGRLRAAQTPQVVRREAWLEAAALSEGDETDDAAMLARAGLEVRTVEGDPSNLKVTRPIDLMLAQALLAEREGS
ncbi:MAG: 2-C-methyl-D-erythritol 4-phosphate cytidylyltransferase [Chloroflexi bacterium]|nr:2-C-methyl-D-erythritol 4-phosphate cytidylyltransferase [Chloroflexota bacterium]